MNFACLYNHCYICDNSTTTVSGHLIPIELQDRFLVWYEHLLEIQGKVSYQSEIYITIESDAELFVFILS